MKSHQLVLPDSEPYQQRAATLFARMKALEHPDVKRFKSALAEAACLLDSTENGSRYIELYKQYKLQQPPRRTPQAKRHNGVLSIDIRCWRQARLTAAKISIANDFDVKPRELVCLSLLLVGELTDQQLTELLLALPAQKTALLKKQVKHGMRP